MFTVLSSWQSHCESSPGSYDECRTAPSGRRPKTKPDDLGCESACTGCQKLHPPSPFIIITEALNDNGQSTRSRANPFTLSSLNGKLKNATKKFKYIKHHKDQRYRGIRKQIAKSSKIKAKSSQPTCKNCLHLCAPLQ